MADIRQKLEPDGCVTFTSESEKGRAWMLGKCKESNCTYALRGIEKAEAERFLKQAQLDGLDVSEPD